MTTASSNDRARLRFASSILARLGEELIPDADQGLLELARNSYDAGASRCVIELSGVEQPQGSVLVSDDGEGMTQDDLVNGFLVLGRSRKSGRRHGRLTVGEKGLGRLAALRLGEQVIVRTRPAGQRIEHTLVLDWKRFDEADVVEDVILDITTQATNRASGTDLQIDRLRQPMNRSQQESLARSLLLLGDPFGAHGDFDAILHAEGFFDLAELVRSSYLAAADFKLTATLDAEGRAEAQLEGLNGQVIASASHEQLSHDSSRYLTPPARFELYVFRLGGGPTRPLNVHLRQVGVRKVGNWLKVVGGVHLYHRGLRVRPFGDPGYDWLQLDVRRARSPEDRPSTNTVVGRVITDDDRDSLIPKTDRLGFIENEAFTELKRFAVDATEFMAGWRTEDSRKRRVAEKRRTETIVQTARAELDTAIKALPAAARAQIEPVARKLERATESRDEARLRDIQLYRTLSTIGAATAVFAHESEKPTELLQSLLRSARRRVKRELGDAFSPKIEEPFDQLDRVAGGLRSLTRMPLRLLRADRRRLTNTSIGASVSDTINTFEFFLERAGVSVEARFSDDDHVRAPAAALEVVAANMIVNAVAAFISDTRVQKTRTLRLSTARTDSGVTFEVSDDGPGLQGISTDDVWKLGETRREGGSGLGLAIVRDTVTDLGGTTEAISPGPLGGATFLVHLPATR